MQMGCRTRKMSELIVYNSEKKSVKPRFKSLKACRKFYKKLMNTNEKILKMSKSTNEDDEYEIVDNTFFKLYCYEEYQRELFYSGYDQHMIDIFKNIGFNVIYEGETKTLADTKNKEMDANFQIMNDDAYDNFIKIKDKEGEDENADKTLKSFYKCYNDKANLLCLTSRENLEIYKDVIMSDYNMEDYFRTLNLLRPSQYIKDKLLEKQKNSMGIKVINSVFNKISILEQIENHYNFERFNIDVNKIDMSKGNNKILTKLYNDLFSRRSPKTFNTPKDVLTNYISIINTITGYFKVIDTKYGKDKGKDKGKDNKGGKRKSIKNYTIRQDVLIALVKLAMIRNPVLKNFDTTLIEKLTQIKPEKKEYITLGCFYDDIDIEDEENEGDGIVDEDDMIVCYKFKKTEKKF
jgi:hypothetical protein